MRTSQFLFFWHAWSMFSTSMAVFFANETDRLALLAFKNGIATDPAGVLSSWNETVRLCDWTGVSCGHDHPGRVAILNLSSWGLGGTISPSTGNLSFLQTIDLSNNGLYGEIPPEMGRLHRLRALTLDSNSLHGVVPVNLTYCMELSVLSLGSNQLTGAIPAEIGLLPKLDNLFLFNNSLTGAIPPSIGNLSSLTALSLMTNHLEGSIPEELGSLWSLGFINVATNMLSGTIPSGLFNISSLYYFCVALNELQGRLPASLGTTFGKITNLLLGSNKFTGPIPSSLYNASRLEMIDLSRNNFTGLVPDVFGGMQDLNQFNLEKNQLQASDESDWRFVGSLTNCSNLQVFSVYHNDLGGMLPRSIANFSRKMQLLAMHRNQISGTIPPGIENLNQLYALDLGDNLLTGMIPEEIGKLGMLQHLGFARNKLTGHIPSTIGNLTQLIELFLFENGFTGTIPSTIIGLQQLQTLSLFSNNLSGRIPVQVLSRISLIDLDLSMNSFDGTLPSEIGGFKNLKSLSLSGNWLPGEIPGTIEGCQVLEDLRLQDNFFNGSIPSSLGNIRGLRNLNLSDNSLSGNIPATFSKLKALEVLCLSNNNLSGPIPGFLQNLSSLITLDLSFNHLEGEVPREGVFKNTSLVSLVGNIELCGGVPQLHFPICPSNESNRRRTSRFIVPIVIPIVSLTLCMLFLFVSFVVLRLRRKHRQSRTLSVTFLDHQFPRVSYKDLVEATDRFSPNNLIGKGSHGSVYRGNLDVVDTIVAIKVFHLHKQGASESFLSECEGLRNIRHHNLVKILTLCSSVDHEGNDFKALVFEFMPNGSLETWLHPEQESQQQREESHLSLIQRLNVAIDVANALQYLHHDCLPPIVHRDLKPSNVLLDNNMTAHIGDFGIAKLLIESTSNSVQGSTSSMAIKGTIGYVAPEYGAGGQASTEGDVYSYGTLLLEMLTGKKPFDEAFMEDLTMQKYVEMYASTQRIMEIMDPLMLTGKELVGHDGQGSNAAMEIRQCLVSAVGVGLSCSKAIPNARLSMTEVVARMNAIRNTYLGLGAHEEHAGTNPTDRQRSICPK